ERGGVARVRLRVPDAERETPPLPIEVPTEVGQQATGIERLLVRQPVVMPELGVIGRGLPDRAERHDVPGSGRGIAQTLLPVEPIANRKRLVTSGDGPQLFEHTILIDILSPPQYWARRHDEYSSREGGWRLGRLHERREPT